MQFRRSPRPLSIIVLSAFTNRPHLSHTGTKVAPPSYVTRRIPSYSYIDAPNIARGRTSRCEVRGYLNPRAICTFVSCPHLSIRTQRGSNILHPPSGANSLGIRHRRQMDGMALHNLFRFRLYRSLFLPNIARGRLTASRHHLARRPFDRRTAPSPPIPQHGHAARAIR